MTGIFRLLSGIICLLGYLKAELAFVAHFLEPNGKPLTIFKGSLKTKKNVYVVV